MRRLIQHIRQRGIVSMIVTMVLLVVISLIVLGFSQLSRREARENLDRKLSTQAFLAAETGINDAREYIEGELAAGRAIPPKNNCPTNAGGSSYAFDPIIDGPNKVSYTCLTVDPEVFDLQADVAAGGHSVTLAIDPAGGTINGLQVRWHAKSAVTSVSGCPGSIPGSNRFPSVTSGNWTCPYGVLRLDLVPSDTLNRTVMEAGQRTMFIYPVNAGGAATQAYATADGRIVPMNCTTAECALNITGLAGFSTYMMRASAYYLGGDLTIVATNPAGNALGLENGQVQIDATGRAQDVLRRVQVRVPLTNVAGTFPDFAVESASSICKRFESTGGVLTNAPDIAGQDSNNPLCLTYAEPVRPEIGGTHGAA